MWCSGFCSKLRAPHRGPSLGPFGCGARACLLCSYSPQSKTQSRRQARERPTAVARVAFKSEFVAPQDFWTSHSVSLVAFRVFPAGRAGDARVAFCTISCFVDIFRVCVCVCGFGLGALERRKGVRTITRSARPRTKRRSGRGLLPLSVSEGREAEKGQ
jgi:hypothetical protein